MRPMTAKTGRHGSFFPAAALVLGWAIQLVAAPVARAGLPEVYYDGIAYPGCSARAMGMGMSRLVDLTPLGALTNPALLSGLPRGLVATMSGGLTMDTERRSLKVYDSFGSVMGESETSYNEGVDLLPAGVALSVRGVDWLPSSIAAGFGWRVPSAFSYDYSRTIRNEAYVETGTERLEVSGAMNEIDLSVAFLPSSRLCLGLGAGYRTGTRTITWTEDYVDPTLEDVLLSDGHDMTGLVVRGSAMLRPVGRVSLFAGIEQPMGLEHSDGLTDGGTLELPTRLFAAGLYVPGNRLRTTFAGSFYWSGDGSASYAGTDLGLDDSWGLGAGVEHCITGGPRVRFGFAYDRSPLSRALDAMTFATGLGAGLGGWEVDLGLSFSPRRWRKASVPDLFPYDYPGSPLPSPSFDQGDSLSVEESSTRLLLSVTRSFDL